MAEERYLLDILFEKFQNALPKHLQPHAVKIEFGVIIAGIFAVLAYNYGWSDLLAFLMAVGLLYGVIFLWAFLRWLFTGR